MRRRDYDSAADQEEAASGVASPGHNPAEETSRIMRAKLTPSLQRQLEALATALTREQALWVSGYFAALADRVIPANIEVPDDTPASSIALATAPTVLYGSETGNGVALAEHLAVQLRAAGFEPVTCDMDSYKLRQLKEERILLVITSTHGEGAPPQSALNFFEYIEGRKAPRLAGLRYAVLALGDSTYEHFCEAGKRLDRRLEELGATRLIPRADCDVDYETPAIEWTAGIIKCLPKEEAHPGAARVTAISPLVPPGGATPSGPAFDKHNPFAARIIDNFVLTGRGSSKETRHIELDLMGSNLAFSPGDALGIVPRNDPTTVEAILSHTRFDAEAKIALKGASLSLGEALSRKLEIVTATPRFLEKWAEINGAAELRRLASPNNGGERNAYLHAHHVIDIMRAFPVTGLSPDAFVTGLRPLQPRLYSIASSQTAAPGEVHLTVASVRYSLHGDERTGVASGHLAARGQPDTTLPVYIQANPHFRLPADDMPILMIGAGTGIAPYRAFLQEREVRAAAGRSWLFFGERNFRTDFLYQTEWQTWLKDGVLSRMDVAFSRDRNEKHYVQHRLRERARDIFAWLEEGAHIYVCGDATNLAPDVHAALKAVVQEQGNLGSESAEDYLRGLQRDHRYQRDVY